MDQGTRTLSRRAWQVWSWLLFGSALGCALAASRPARADVQRFAIVIGNDRGAADEQPLRYAESDARRVYDVLRELGGFTPANMVLLSGEDARTAEDTVIAINERVRSALALPGSQAMLFVYYSGHADAEALHLGDSELPARRLAQLVHGSAATFRLMVLDACRSGALTRRKGGKIVAASRLLSEDALPGSGLAVLAASAAHEDAQESEAIRGSFFTHAFVSGLMGAADQRRRRRGLALRGVSVLVRRDLARDQPHRVRHAAPHLSLRLWRTGRRDPDPARGVHGDARAAALPHRHRLPGAARRRRGNGRGRGRSVRSPARAQRAARSLLRPRARPGRAVRGPLRAQRRQQHARRTERAGSGRVCAARAQERRPAARPRWGSTSQARRTCCASSEATAHRA